MPHIDTTLPTSDPFSFLFFFTGIHAQTVLVIMVEHVITYLVSLHCLCIIRHPSIILPNMRIFKIFQMFAKTAILDSTAIFVSSKGNAALSP